VAGLAGRCQAKLLTVHAACTLLQEVLPLPHAVCPLLVACGAQQLLADMLAAAQGCCYAGVMCHTHGTSHKGSKQLQFIVVCLPILM
jgi:hypothetical protein